MDCFLMSKTLAIDCVTITESSTKSNHLTVRRCCICHQDDFDGDDEEQEKSVGIRWSRLHLARRILVRDSIVSDFNIGVFIEPIDGPQNYRKIMDKKNVASIENNEIVRGVRARSARIQMTPLFQCFHENVNCITHIIALEHRYVATRAYRSEQILSITSTPIVRV